MTMVSSRSGWSARSVLLVAAVASAASLLAACESGNLEDQTAREGRNKHDIRQGLGGKSQVNYGDSIFGPGGLFGSRQDKRQGLDEPGVAVNSFLWRASLDTLNFMPLASADPFGGVIITDWYSPPESPNERLKVSILILDRDLRADGVRATVFRQQMAGARGWVEAPVDPKTGRELEDTILTRARQLRVAQLGS
jgi:hypothetical protein